MAVPGFRASKTFAILMVCVAIFTDMFLANLVAPVLPFALSDIIGLEEEQVQLWNSTLIAIYGGALTFGSGLNADTPPASIGLMADHLRSKQTLFLWGLIALALTTFGFAVGRTLPVLVATRFLQGLSSAIVFGLGATILLEVVGKERMGSMSGLTGLVVGLGLQLGPIVGGLLYEHAGYFAVFLPALALLVVDVMLRLLYIPNEKCQSSPTISRRSSNARPAPSKDDEDGEQQRRKSTSRAPENEPLLSSHASHEPVGTSGNPTEHPWPSVLVLAMSPRFLTILLAGMYLNAAPSGIDATLPVYLRSAFGQSSAQVVPFFVCLCAPILCAPLVGLLSDRIGPKWPAAAAFTAYTGGMLGLAQVTPGMEQWRPAMLCLLVVLGTGGTFGFPPINADVGHTVAAIQESRPGMLRGDGAYASAYSLLTAATAAGSVVGPLYAGLVRDRLGWTWTMSSFGLVSAVILALVLLLTGGVWSRKYHRPRNTDTDEIT